MTAGGAVLHTLYAFALNGPLLWAACVASSRFHRPGDVMLTNPAARCGVDRLLVLVVAVASAVVLIVTLGGVLGILNRPAFMLGIAWFAALLLRVLSGRGRAQGPPASAADARTFSLSGSRPVWRSEVAMAGLLVLVTWIPLIAERLLLPPVAWDALTYHLHFPAIWLREGTLATASAPVGDPSNPYFPLAGEMLLYWVLLSTGTDQLTSLSQVPTALAGAAAIAALAARLGASRSVAAVAGLCWLATPAILRQSVEAMVDVQLAAWWLLAIHAIVRWRDGARGPWLLVAGASLGLLIGTKYSGLLYAAALLPLLIRRLGARSRGGHDGSTRHLAGAVLLALIVGGFAYARNFWNSANPLLPLTIGISGHTIAPGVVGPDYYFGSETPRLSWARLFFSGRALLDAGPALPLVLAALPTSLAWRRDETGLRRPLAVCGLLAFLLGAFLMPYREHRYFFPVLAVGWAVLGAILSVRGVATFALRGAVVLLALSAPVTLFYWTKDLVLVGPAPEHAAAGLGALLLAFGIVFRERLARVVSRFRPSSRSRPQGALVVASLCVVAILSLAASSMAYEQARYESWARYWGSRHEWERPHEARADYRDMGASWEVLARETGGRGAAVAYAGMNAPYPLAGRSFANRVHFVPRGNEAGASVYDWGSKPTVCREAGSRASWMRNVEHLGVEYLCVYRVARRDDPTAYRPVEWEWAEQDPMAFELIWSAEYARIYRREQGRAAVGGPSE